MIIFLKLLWFLFKLGIKNSKQINKKPYQLLIKPLVPLGGGNHARTSKLRAMSLASDSTWCVGQARLSRCSHMTPRRPSESPWGWGLLSETYQRSFAALNEFSSMERAGRGCFDSTIEEICRRMTVCLRGGALLLQRVRGDLFHLCAVWNCRHVKWMVAGVRGR